MKMHTTFINKPNNILISNHKRRSFFITMIAHNSCDALHIGMTNRLTAIRDLLTETIEYQSEANRSFCFIASENLGRFQLVFKS